MIGREVPEWIGATPDTPIPPRVRLRVFDRHKGICHISGRKIMSGEPWDCEHITALCNGGEHREFNLAPALRDKHREKTAVDVAERARVDKIRKRQLGIRKRPSFACSKSSPWKKKIDGSVVRRDA